jgi:hypothetical protein
MTDQQKLPLQIITYLVPSLSVEIFETIAQYLESALGRETTLVYESRFIGPQPDRIDPFKTRTADLGNSLFRFYLHHRGSTNKYDYFIVFKPQHLLLEHLTNSW